MVATSEKNNAGKGSSQASRPFLLCTSGPVLSGIIAVHLQFTGFRLNLRVSLGAPADEKAEKSKSIVLFLVLPHHSPLREVTAAMAYKPTVVMRAAAAAALAGIAKAATMFKAAGGLKVGAAAAAVAAAASAAVGQPRKEQSR
ncbi:hypothetical protein R1sor_011224 [Riccia sorocarpa]|uniref:Uncharacterized protein n=1 Tax=Riccia sorocarpa TaxID=122646 RepID=A0ABD3I0M5_9MARC